MCNIYTFFFSCKAEYHIEDVKNSILNRKIPYCEKPIDNEKPLNFNFFSKKIPKSYTEAPDGPEKLFCGGLVKPDIVFFGENLPHRFFELQEQDTENCDLLICIGTSLEVYPFAGTYEILISKLKFHIKSSAIYKKKQYSPTHKDFPSQGAQLFTSLIADLKT